MRQSDPCGSSPRVRGTRSPSRLRRDAGRFIPARAGNTKNAALVAEEDNGSSPRVRGTHHVVQLRVGGVRFIPARAGNTPRRRASSLFLRGSSPRVRGTRTGPGRRPLPSRFIPARAGNTPQGPVPTSTGPVHPRACGEHDSSSSSLGVASGSSPRVRGTRPMAAAGLRAQRFIPARAGNTSSAAAGIVRRAVHPRACGEHRGGAGQGLGGPGSSPRVRGTRHQRHGERDPHRFIPARAGNTQASRKTEHPLPVHPRACGEHSTGRFATRNGLGSSPRVRGTRREDPLPRPGRRFIPARAGNTGCCGPRRTVSTVHPRACGEHEEVAVLMPNEAGSSPRVRGTRHGYRRPHPTRRFIPARAGNTTD